MTVLMTLVITPELEEIVTDWLLMHPHIDGFTSHTARGHGSHHALSTAEQVRGMRQQVQFSVVISEALLELVVSDLKQKFMSTPVHYWVTPIIEQGSLSP